MGFTYPYVEDLRPGENQYDALYDLDQDTIVDAVYNSSENAPGIRILRHCRSRGV